MMKNNLTITYQLKTNEYQYRYLCHELSKNTRMYETLLQQKQRCQCKLCDDQQVKGYAKRFIPEMSVLERHYMIEQLRNGNERYQCLGVLDRHYQWRGVNLFDLVDFHNLWTKLPFLNHWDMLISRLYVHHRVLYLSITFDKLHK